MPFNNAAAWGIAYFGITDTKLRIAKRKIKFAQNELCKIFADVGRRESADLSIPIEVECLLNSA